MASQLTPTSSQTHTESTRKRKLDRSATADDLAGHGHLPVRRSLRLELDSPVTAGRPAPSLGISGVEPLDALPSAPAPAAAATATATTPSTILDLLTRASEHRGLLLRLPSDQVVQAQQYLAELMSETVAALRRAPPS